MIIICDTETTGLPNAEGSPLDSQPKIIEFAAIKFDNDFNEIDRLTFICNPMCIISDLITKLTGLKQADVDDKQPFSYFYPQLCNFFLGCETMIAHNLTFDRSLIEFELRRLGKLTAFPWPFKQICTIEKSMHIKGYRLKLGLLHKELCGEDYINGAHRAMNDVEALTRICKKLREQQII